jgi:hypothetical protein
VKECRKRQRSKRFKKDLRDPTAAADITVIAALSLYLRSIHPSPSLYILSISMIMILPALHQFLTSRVATPVLLSEEEETTTTTRNSRNSNSDEEASSSRSDAPPSTSSSASFPDSDIPPSRYYNYSVGPLAHVKSEGRDDDNEMESYWKLNDFTIASVNSDDDDDSTRSSTPSSFLGSGKFGTVQLYKEHSSSRKVALKTMNKRISNAIRCLLWKREVEIQTR